MTKRTSENEDNSADGLTDGRDGRQLVGKVAVVTVILTIAGFLSELHVDGAETSGNCVRASKRNQPCGPPGRRAALVDAAWSRPFAQAAGSRKPPA